MTVSSFLAAVRLAFPAEVLFALLSTALLIAITFYFVHHKRVTRPK